jgi:hypothetical protein
VPRLAVATVLVCAVVGAGSWVGFIAARAGSDATDGATPASTSPSTDVEEPGASDDTEASVDEDRPFCAEAYDDQAEGWFLYETAGGVDQIVIEEGGDPVSSLSGSAFSAAGSRLVHVDASDSSRVRIVDVATLDVTATKRMEGHVVDTTISRDGDTVVLVERIGGDTRLVLWRPSTDQVDVIHDPRPLVSSPSLTPEGDRVVWVQGDDESGEIRSADLETFVVDTIALRGGHPAWAPDGRGVVYSAEYGEGQAIYFVAGGSTEPRRITNPVQAVDYDPVVLPSCDGVVYARARDGMVDLWEIRANEPEMILRELQGAQSRPSFATK